MRLVNPLGHRAKRCPFCEDGRGWRIDRDAARSAPFTVTCRNATRPLAGPCRIKRCRRAVRRSLPHQLLGILSPDRGWSPPSPSAAPPRRQEVRHQAAGDRRDRRQRAVPDPMLASQFSVWSVGGIDPRSRGSRPTASLLRWRDLLPRFPLGAPSTRLRSWSHRCPRSESHLPASRREYGARYGLLRVESRPGFP